MTHDTDTSNKPLEQRLGFQPGDTVFVDTTPDWYSDFADQAGFEITPDLPATHAHLFIAFRAELQEFLDDYNVQDVKQTVWFSWPAPSGSSSKSIKTDLSEQSFRDVLLPLGWVATELMAIDDAWLGLGFVRRKTSTAQ